AVGRIAIAAVAITGVAVTDRDYGPATRIGVAVARVGVGVGAIIIVMAPVVAVAVPIAAPVMAIAVPIAAMVIARACGGWQGKDGAGEGEGNELLHRNTPRSIECVGRRDARHRLTDGRCASHPVPKMNKCCGGSTTE